MTNYQKQFETLTKKHIKRKGIDKLLESLSKSDFYTAPASTRYHHSYKGGLVKHSIEVFHYLMEDLKDSDKYSKESLAIVSLFHDVCKVGFYTTEMRNSKENGKWVKVPYYTVDDKFPLGHSEKSIIMIREYMKLSADEMLAINAHMGGFDARGANVISNTFDMCPLAIYLHGADLKSTYMGDK